MQNYAQKYSEKVDELFTREALTPPAVNQDYEFIGVETVKVYGVSTAEMGDYVTSGSYRYGNPEELDNTTQELTLTRDRSFTYTIDRKSEDDSMMVMEAGRSLARQIRERVVPEVDNYRFLRMAQNAGFISTNSITKSSAYEEFINLNAQLDDGNVPKAGRIGYVTPDVFNKLKLDPSFVKTGDMSLRISLTGLVGEVDGVPVVTVPTSRMPAGVRIIIAHNSATTAPMKLIDYKIHENPPYINGWLVEGRIRYDAFVLNNKKAGIAVNATATTTHTVTFDGNGNTTGRVNSAVTGFDNGKFKAPNSNMTKSGKAFAKWNTSADGSGTDVEVGSDITISADTTLYAIYES